MAFTINVINFKKGIMDPDICVPFKNYIRGNQTTVDRNNSEYAGVFATAIWLVLEYSA